MDGGEDDGWRRPVWLDPKCELVLALAINAAEREPLGSSMSMRMVAGIPSSSSLKAPRVISPLASMVTLSPANVILYRSPGVASLVCIGLAAVVALVHDVLVSLGFVAMASWVSGTPIGDLFLIDDFRINLPMIAAFLTLVGYSLNDTIVMFDRIREVRGKNPAITVSMVNLSLNQTLGRTILTATTVFIVVFILYAFGGAGIHGFAWCLLVGCIAGTYSSIYIASPILIWALNKVQGTVKA